MSKHQNLKKFPIEIGTKVVIVPWGNIARRNSVHKEAEVVKIGRKFFYVAVSKQAPEHMWERFDLDSYACSDKDMNGGYDIWPDESSYLHYRETEKKYSRIREYFTRHYKRQISDASVDAIYGALVADESQRHQDNPELMEVQDG